MSGQISISDYLGNMTHDRDGSLRPAPEWMDERRCENCNYWMILAKEHQPATGWGVYGQCTSHRHRGHEVTQTSYCDDFIRR